MGAPFSNRGSLIVGAGLSVFLASGYATKTAQAQSQSVFCPNISDTLHVGSGPTTLQAGLCTNSITGAQSIAALTSQMLSQNLQSSDQLFNGFTSEMMARRRKEEADQCPVGWELLGGVCRQIPSAPFGYLPVLENGYSAAVPWPQPKQTATLGGEAPIAPSAPMTYKGEPAYQAPPIVDSGIHPAIWAHGFGDFQQQTASFVAPGPGPGIGTVGVAIGSATPMFVALDSKTTIWGFLSGADLTFHGVAVGGDVLITGLLAGYLTSTMNLNTTSTSSDSTSALGGSSTTQIRLSGPSAGAYATYFTGPISTDLTFRADFLSINNSFSEILNFLAPDNSGTLAPKPPVISSGIVTASVTDLSIIGNYNYRIPVYGGIWIEPTAGFDYTYSLYDAAAASLGVSDGYVWVLQGGARLGIDNYFGPVHVTQTITGLAYDDVKIVGGPVLNGAFIGGPLLNFDEGKIRGEGIYAVDFNCGHGLSSFVQGIVYGGEDLIGAGGKVGVRYQW
jgi:Autotransporter beta-domain